ncbi:MAG: hypothetical protein ACRDV4_05380, partial [Acidimicrobiales bacterium]
KLGARGRFVNWLVARDHTAWANVETDVKSRTAVTETFRTTGSAPEKVVDAATTPMLSDIGEGPFDAPAVLDAPPVGLVAAKPGWIGTVGTPGASSESIVKLDPATGRSTKVATVKTRPAGKLEANIVYEGALYLLIGQIEDSATATVYRIAL